MSRVAVVGAGLSGLVAAHELRRILGPELVVDLYEASGRLGGILHGVDVAGRTTDVGAEAFVLRRPEARDLVAELGLADEIVVPTDARPALWACGRLRPMPTPTWMGIPASPEAVAEVADDEDLARMATEPDRPLAWTAGADCSLGELVADRFGPSVVARVLDPMVGGVYSCLAADTGLRAALPALAARLDEGAPSLTAAVAALLPAPTAPRTPVFGALRGGYRALVDALVESAAPRTLLDTPVAEIAAAGRSWSVAGQVYDAVVVATPAPVAARQLGAVAPDSAEALGTIATAAPAVVALALPVETALPAHSGVLVATGEELAGAVKAITFSSRKWDHLDVGEPGPAPHRVRASFGRLGQPVTASDAELVAIARAAVGQACGTAVGEPVDVAVARWSDGLPCYAPGHDALVEAVFAGLPASIALAGSAYRGVGVPACIGQARAAAAAVRAHLAQV
ncbi:FAD-dependent oxidoreductase [Gordonia sp. X0973]|uniref:FAD-dependent oxidoreductase n=1 Tax=Gordonia sp. X0973 TaxID=2742602 RepID=UPI000F52CB47|nr:FAD-dependent oxidoreductase [Gordonia sp. X0973]QKT07235.1 FAD-dependent oxidoreductase [Gordonia sp. X0973]